jgi:hypothetical protein
MLVYNFSKVYKCLQIFGACEECFRLTRESRGSSASAESFINFNKESLKRREASGCRTLSLSLMFRADGRSNTAHASCCRLCNWCCPSNAGGLLAAACVTGVAPQTPGGFWLSQRQLLTFSQ